MTSGTSPVVTGPSRRERRTRPESRERRSAIRSAWGLSGHPLGDDAPPLPDGRIRLQPANSSLQPIYVTRKDLEIQGKVLAVLRKYK